MREQEFITVSEMAKKKGVSKKRILQILQDDPEKKAQCKRIGSGMKRPTLFLLPPSLFDDYSPIGYRQKAGLERAKIAKSLKKKKNRLTSLNA